MQVGVGFFHKAFPFSFRNTFVSLAFKVLFLDEASEVVRDILHLFGQVNLLELKLLLSHFAWHRILEG